MGALEDSGDSPYRSNLTPSERSLFRSRSDGLPSVRFQRLRVEQPDFYSGEMACLDLGIEEDDKVSN